MDNKFAEYQSKLRGVKLKVWQMMDVDPSIALLKNSNKLIIDFWNLHDRSDETDVTKWTSCATVLRAARSIRRDLREMGVKSYSSDDEKRSALSRYFSYFFKR